MKHRFCTTTILDAIWAQCARHGEPDEDAMMDAVYSSELIDAGTSDHVRGVVFPYEGAHWQIEVRHDSDCYWNSLTGTDGFTRPWKVETTSFEATEVRQVTKTVTVWEPVGDES